MQHSHKSRKIFWVPSFGGIFRKRRRESPSCWWSVAVAPTTNLIYYPGRCRLYKNWTSERSGLLRYMTKSESFPIGFDSTTSAQTPSNKSLRSVTKLLPEQLYLEDKHVVLFLQLSQPIRRTNRCGGKIRNTIEKKTFEIVRSLLSGLHSYPLILLKYWRQSLNRDTLRAKIVTLQKCLKRKSMRFATKKSMNVISNSSVWAKIKLFQRMLKLNFRWRWAKIKLTNQKLFTTWFACTNLW